MTDIGVNRGPSELADGGPFRRAFAPDEDLPGLLVLWVGKVSGCIFNVDFVKQDLGIILS